MILDTIEHFDTFSIKWIDKSNNFTVDFMANLSIKHNDIPFLEMIQIEVKSRPTILDNIQNWQE